MPFPLNQLPGDDDLESQTKSDLQERAAELDIAGRSNMTKEELVDAIRRAQLEGGGVDPTPPIAEERRNYPREEQADFEH